MIQSNYKMTYSGICPLCNSEMELIIKISKINHMGQKICKVSGVNCEFASFNGCPNPDNCPIVRQALSEIE